MSGRWGARSGPKQKTLITTLPGLAGDKAWAPLLFPSVLGARQWPWTAPVYILTTPLRFLQTVNSFVQQRVWYRMTVRGGASKVRAADPFAPRLERWAGAEGRGFQRLAVATGLPGEARLCPEGRLALR